MNARQGLLNPSRRGHMRNLNSNKRFVHCKGKNIPGTGKDVAQIFDFSYIKDSSTIDFIKGHGRVLLFLRGPPGTMKGDLCKLLEEIYPEAFLLSAKEYKKFAFLTPRSSLSESKTILQISHAWCLEMLEKNMRENQPIIILRNTHVTRWEIEFYLELIRTFRYTVIMVETPRKFRINSELLCYSNKQGLGKDYFENRLKTWCTYFPWYTGWFLNPADSELCIAQGFKVFRLILECTTYNLDLGLSSRAAKQHFEKEEEIFCICCYCKYDEIKTKNNHYIKEEVQDSLGKAFPLRVYAYVINPDHIVALVYLNEEQIQLGSLESIFKKILGDEDGAYKFKVKAPEIKIEKQSIKKLDNEDNDDSASISSTDTIKDMNEVLSETEEIEKEEGIEIEENYNVELSGNAETNIASGETKSISNGINSDCQGIDWEDYNFEDASVYSMSLDYVRSVSSSKLESYKSLAPTCTDAMSEMSTRNLQEDGIDALDERVIEYVPFSEPISLHSKSTVTKEKAHFKSTWCSENLDSIGVIILATNRDSCGFLPHLKRPNYYLKRLFDGVKQEGFEETDIKGTENFSGGKLFRSNTKLEYVFFPKEELIFESIFNGLY